MSTLTPRLTATLAGLLSLAWLGSAQAAPCGRPDVDATFPPDAAKGVPSNAVLTAHYGSPAVYADEPVSVTDAAGNAVSVTVTYDDADSLLRAAPAQGLSDGEHQIVWPGLRGVSGGAGVGRGSTVGFLVRSAPDTAPPVFGGLSDIAWDLARDRDPCLDRLDDRFVFKLRVGQASDDSGVGLLALRVFETVDPTSNQAAPTSLGVKAWPSSGVLEVRRPATQAGRTCFAAFAEDLLGQASGGGEREVCVKTKQPPFFDGCAVAAAGPGALPPLTAWHAGLLLLSLARLRRGRAPHARAPRAA